MVNRRKACFWASESSFTDFEVFLFLAPVVLSINGRFLTWHVMIAITLVSRKVYL